jgi:hypothetical protein
MLAAGLKPDTALQRREAETRLVARYVGAIEAFPDASMQDILVIRGQLEEPLVRFRGAMNELATEAASAPPSDDFGAVAEDLYRHRVAPRMQELTELSEELKLPRLLRRQAGQAGAGVKALLALLVVNYVDIPAVVKAAAAVAAVGADTAAGVLSRASDIDEARRANQFLWLYQAEKELRRV